MALLQAAAAECEEKSEEIATKFQNKELTIDEYLEKFMTVRKMMHARKLKIEKMSEILQKQPFQPSTNFYSPSYPVHMPNQAYRNF